MTCIAAVAHDGKVYMGGDSAGVGGYDLTVRADVKVFRKGPYVMGFTSSFRMGQLLRHSLKAPAPAGHIERFMCTTFVDAVRDCLKAGGFAASHHETESGGTFLVGVAGRLFQVDSDYQVGESRDRYDAVGCGAGYALGVLHLSGRQGLLEPRARVRLALEAAAHHSAGVRGPFRVVVGGAV